MREVVLRVQASALEDVLDRLLPIVPGGVRELPAGPDVELLIRGDGLPSLETLAAAVSPAPYEISERRVPDDWRQRRLADYRPQIISGRLVVRPDWAPVPPSGLIDIALADAAAFGEGEHPTTLGCLRWLLELKPAGAFADLGCGSGVLAILASRLGWSPVVAIDFQQVSVEAAQRNIAGNDVAVEVALSDLRSDDPPAANGFAANVPAEVHGAVAARWRAEAPGAGLVSGFGAAEAEQVLAAYGAIGLRERRRMQRIGWVVAELGRE